MQAIEIIVIVFAVLIVVGVIGFGIYRKYKAKKIGVPYMCSCCPNAKLDQKTGKVQCSGHCANQENVKTMTDKEGENV